MCLLPLIWLSIELSIKRLPLIWLALDFRTKVSERKTEDLAISESLCVYLPFCPRLPLHLVYFFFSFCFGVHTYSAFLFLSQKVLRYIAPTESIRCYYLNNKIFYFYFISLCVKSERKRKKFGESRISPQSVTNVLSSSEHTARRPHAGRALAGCAGCVKLLQDIGRRRECRPGDHQEGV